MWRQCWYMDLTIDEGGRKGGIGTSCLPKLCQRSGEQVRNEVEYRELPVQVGNELPDVVGRWGKVPEAMSAHVGALSRGVAFPGASGSCGKDGMPHGHEVFPRSKMRGEE